MKNNKLVPIILVSILIVLVAVVIALTSNSNYFELSNNSTNKQNNSGKIKEEVESVSQKNSDKEEDVTEVVKESKIEEVETVSKVQEEEKIEKKDTIKEEVIVENKVETKQEVIVEDKNDSSVDVNNNSIVSNEVEESKTNEVIEEVSFSENDVVAYFRVSEENLGTNQSDKTTREKIKESFITIVDFIFYDKEIKGYTFSELTTKAKLEVIEVALTIDNKIDKYFPDYKNTIKEKYTSIKGKLASKYLEFTASLCDSVGTDVCNQAKEDFNSMKESFGFTWELIKELASNGSSKVKEFYESWRDSE